jgi:parallel beta-helix repeat protein
LRANVISGNDATGIDIIPSSVGNVIKGNFIGTDSTGTHAVPNHEGISVRVAVPGLNTIGGETGMERNIISGNSANGIVCYDARALITGNYIGMNASGAEAIPNGVSGLSLRFGCDATVRGNVISGNGNDGIEVVGEEQNEIAANSIHDNGALGIDLGDNGVTPNDPGDADSGPNGLQNFPVLDTAQSDGSSVSVNGTFNSQSNQSYRIEFFGSAACDVSGYGEGETFLGSAQIQTDAGGNAAISTTIPAQVGGVMYLTATATSSATSSTSEFSGCALVLGPHGDMNCDLLVDAADALQIFRYLAGLPMHQQTGCPDIGSEVASVFGDVDCSGDVTAADAMMDLRHAAGLPVNLLPGCGPIGVLVSFPGQSP